MEEQNQEPSQPTIECRENGPYQVTDLNRVIDTDGKVLGPKSPRMLCRCGRSGYQPFCDGMHISSEFEAQDSIDTAVGSPPFQSDDSEGSAEESGEPTLTVTEKGPYQVQGAVKLKAGEKSVDLKAGETYLCRCGKSSTKPHCDGTHKTIGYQGDQFIRIATISELTDELTRVRKDDRELVIIKRDAILKVYSGVCLHAGALLSGGFIEDEKLTCSKHRWQYDLETGELVGDPSMGLKKLATKTEEDFLYVDGKALSELPKTEE